MWVWLWLWLWLWLMWSAWQRFARRDRHHSKGKSRNTAKRAAKARRACRNMVPSLWPRTDHELFLRVSRGIGCDTNHRECLGDATMAPSMVPGLWSLVLGPRRSHLPP